MVWLINGTFKKFGLLLFSQALSQQKSFIYFVLSRFSTSYLVKIEVHQKEVRMKIRLKNKKDQNAALYVLLMMHTSGICCKKGAKADAH